MDDNRKKLLVCLLIFLTGLIGSIYFSTALHQVLSGQMKTLSPTPFTQCIKSIASDEAHRMLFLCLTGFALLFAAFFYFSNSKPYQSKLREITTKIKTPVPAGQKQHGSAEWLMDREKDMVFCSHYINPEDDVINELIRVGYDDLKVDRNGGDKQKHLQKNISTGGEENNYETEEKKTGYDLLPTEGGDSEKTIKRQNIKTQENYLPQGGVVLGYKKQCSIEKFFFVDDDVHTLCIGATRSGKTRTVVLQSIGLLGLAGESMILSDPKGELYQYTYPFLERLGYEVIAIDFKNPLKSHRYNFLQPVIDAIDADDIARAVDATWDLTASLVGEAKGERIWTDGEASIIASAIMSVVYDNKEKENRKFQNLTNVYYFISQMCKTVNNKMPILEYIKKLKEGHPAKGLLAISEVAPSKTRGSFYTAALTTLRLFTNPMINAMTNASDYNPMDTGSKKRAIFIILPDEKTTYYSLASLFVSQHYELLVKAADERGGRLKNRVNFLLDEFGNFVKIPDFANKLTVGGGRRIRFNLFLQSFAQLDEKYGKEVAKTIKGNCENWIYLQADDLETLEEISRKLGNYTVSTYSLSASHARYSTPSSSHSINLIGRPLLTVDEVRLISRPYSLVTSRNNPAIMFAPDLSKMYFNKMFGLGDKEHNRKVRELRENRRPQRSGKIQEIELWNIWLFYIAACEQAGQVKLVADEAKRAQLKSQQYAAALREDLGMPEDDID